MKLETPIDLLERLRAQRGSSWYALAPVLGCTTHTVANWKNGRTSIDRKFAPRIAELLEEPAEYVLACLEADREQDAEMKKVWRRIAERARSTASILLVCLGLMTAHESRAAQVLDVELVGNCQTDDLYIMRNSRSPKGRRWRRWQNHTGTHQVLDLAFDEASPFECPVRAGTTAAR